MMNKDLMFSSKTDLWSTPQELFNKYNEIFHFQIDVCALPENAKCDRFFTPEINGLKQEWDGVCWCNPPYGRQIKEWVKKACESPATVVMLLPARTDTKWFHDYCLPYGKIEFLRGRLKFGGSKNFAPFPSMIVVFNNDNKKINELARQICHLSSKFESCLICDEKYNTGDDPCYFQAIATEIINPKSKSHSF